MFHTLSLIIKLENEKDSTKLWEIMHSYSKKNGRKMYPTNEIKNEYIMDAAKDQGVIWFLAREKKKGDIKYYLKARVTPGLLIRNDYIGLCNAEDLKDIVKKFDKLSREISEDMPRFSDYTINRVDYCVNIDTTKMDQYIAPIELMKLIKRADKPAGYEEFMKYNKKCRKKKPPKNSYYLMNNSVNINIYYKYKQLKDIMPEFDHIEDTRNIIRFEIQCKPSKVKEIRDKNNIGKHDNKELLSPGICEEILMTYFKKIIGNGDYFILTNAKKEIQQSILKEKDKRLALAALDLINLKRSIWKARASLKDEKARKEFNHALDILQNSGINPVTIPRKWGLKKIKSLKSIIKKEIRDK